MPVTTGVARACYIYRELLLFRWFPKQVQACRHVGLHLRDECVNAFKPHLSAKSGHEVQAEFLVIEVTVEPGEKCLDETDCAVESWPVTNADRSRMEHGIR